ncbi:amino acid adenylation domain-containing protein [Prevotellaceae bacterium HUN156]|nr:amino acid adenylation domain-containing protein [Prevotellaceae bacterium HUN156]
MHKKNLLSIFERRIEENGQKTAVIVGENELTYQQLGCEAEHIAKAISHKLSTLPKTDAPIRIGVCIGRNEYLIPSILALFKCGYTYVPLDPVLPQERLSFICEDSGMTMVLTTTEYTHRFPHLPVLDVSMPLEECDYSWNSDSELAYIIYTSGTTGKPKGVTITYDNLYYFLMCAASPEIALINSDARDLEFASIGFDASILEIFGPLYCGATLVVATDEIRNDIGKLYQYINEQKITHASLTPSVLNVLPSLHFTHMKTLRSVGEPMIATVAEKGAQQPYRFIDAYGPTEATVFCFSRLVDGKVYFRNIGKPYEGIITHVVDKDMNELPVGEIGELLIGGRQLTPGYLNRPELNQEKFVDSPFPEDHQIKLYHSGDLAKRMEDGSIEYVGRMDSQIKFHGFRIELDEIRTRIEQEPEVKQAYVRLEEFGSSQYLAAYIEALTPHLDMKVLKKRLSTFLPPYMIPTYWIPVSKFERTVNGKIDKTKLTNPFFEQYVRNSEPLDAKEQMLASVISRIMGIDDVNIDIDLIDELGFSSLQIMQAVQSLAFTGFYTSAKDFYDYHTVRAIAKHHQRTHHYWLHQPEKSKPTLLIVSGYTGFNFLYAEWASRISQKYNIHIIESYFETTEGIVQSTEQMVSKYYDWVKPVIAEYGIDVITGFCVGGELGLYLAHLIHQRDGLLPHVVMLDSDVERTDARAKSVQPNYIHFTPEINALHFDIEMTLMETYPSFHYEGKIAVFLSKLYNDRLSFNETDPVTDEQKAWARKCFEDSPTLWKQHYPDCQLEFLNTDHLDYLRTEESITPLTEYFNNIDFTA